MCQLTYASLNCPIINRIYIANQLLVNTDGVFHKDGFGIFHDWKMEKRLLAPSVLNNFGKILNEVITGNYPVMAHVRQATTTNGFKSVTLDHTHPFRNKNYVLAHNGTLEFKDTKKMRGKEYKNLIDSQIFLHRLSENRNKNKNRDKNFPQLLKLTMDEFRGKFAFIIFDIKQKRFYISRGRTAKLFISFLFRDKSEHVGFVVNTDREDLETALKLTVQNYSAMSGEELTTSRIEILKEESTFVTTELGLTKVEDIKETNIPVIQVTARGLLVPGSTGYYNAWGLEDAGGAQFIGASEQTVKEDKLIKEFLDEALRLNLTLEELDELFLCSLGTRILELKPDDLIHMQDDILPLLKKEWEISKRVEWLRISSPLFQQRIQP